MTAVARVVRSGRIEAVHQASVAVVRADGDVVGLAGDTDRPFFIRSSLKPFQAQVSLRMGAPLAGETLALACASHAGFPDQVEVVERILATSGLSEADLATPAAWPTSAEARDLAVRSGATEPRPIWFSCSGKHAAMLAACVASDFPLDTYLSPSHPLQRAVATEVAEVTGVPAGEPGVDGCGAPIYEMSTVTMARAFARLAADQDRRVVYDALHDHPDLIGEPGKVDGIVADGTGGAAKYGAEACLGLALAEAGLGVALKVWDGDIRAQKPLMAAVLDHLGLLSDELAARLETPVLGGGRTVGWIEADLSWSA